MSGNLIKNVITPSYMFNDYLTKAELEQVFGRGNTYIRALIADLEEYNEQHPETYNSTNLFSTLSNSSRVYYNVFAVNHYLANKMKLAAGRSIQFNEKEERERFHDMLDIQRKMVMAANEFKLTKGGA